MKTLRGCLLICGVKCLMFGSYERQFWCETHRHIEEREVCSAEPQLQRFQLLFLMRLRRVTALNRSAMFYLRAPLCQFINCNVGVLEGFSSRPLLNLALNSQLCTAFTVPSSVLLFPFGFSYFEALFFCRIFFFFLPFALQNFVDFSKSQFEFQPQNLPHKSA